MSLGKLAVVIGAGLVGSVLSKEGNLSTFTDFVSGAFKIVTKHLQQDNGGPRSTGKPKSDALLAQVNHLRQELQHLASSRSVTIVTGSTSGSGTYKLTVIVAVGVVGYGYIWWKGWNFSDMIFVTRRGFSDAYAKVAKELDSVSSSIRSARRHLSSRIDRVDANIDECSQLTSATKDEVSKLHGDLSEFHVEVESVHRVVQSLESKLGRIEGGQDLTTRGLYHLCNFVKRLEQTGHIEQIQASASRPARVSTQTNPVRLMGSSSSLVIEPPSPSSSSIESSKVFRPLNATSTSGLKELQEVSTAFKSSNSRPNLTRSSTSPSETSSTTTAIRQLNSTSNSSRFGFKLPGISILTRTHSTTG